MPKESSKTCNEARSRDMQTCRDKHQGAGGTVKCIREAKQAHAKCEKDAKDKKDKK